MTLTFVLELITAVMIVLSGLFTLAGAIGILSLPTFFARQHPPALAYSAGAWSVGVAAIAHFARVDGYSGLKAVFVTILLALSVSVTNMMLARAGLFRQRWRARQEPQTTSTKVLPEMLQAEGKRRSGDGNGPRGAG